MNALKIIGKIALIGITSMYLISGCGREYETIKPTPTSLEEKALCNYYSSHCGAFGEASKSDLEGCMRTEAALRGLDTTNCAAYDSFRTEELKKYESGHFPSKSMSLQNINNL